MVQKNLFALHSFLEGNPHLFHSATGDYSGARAAPTSDQEAWKVDYIYLELVSQSTDLSLFRLNKSRWQSCKHCLREQSKGCPSFFCSLITASASSLASSYSLGHIYYSPEEFIQNGYHYSEAYCFYD